MGIKKFAWMVIHMRESLPRFAVFAVSAGLGNQTGLVVLPTHHGKPTERVLPVEFGNSRLAHPA